MTNAASSRPEGPELNSGILPGNVRADDWIFLTLAVASAVLLGAMVLDPPAREIGLLLFRADVALGVVFALEFLWRWRKRGWTANYLGRNVYEVLAVAPVAHPDFQSWRFVTTVVLIARLSRVVDRALGEQFFLRMVDRMSGPIVAAIKKPVTVAVLDEVVKVLETGNYPENLAKSLTENKLELQTIITEKIRENRRLTGLRHVPFATEIVEAAVDTSFEVVLEVLQDPRVDAFFAAVVRDNREQIRAAVVLGLADRAEEQRSAVRSERAAAREFDERHPGHRPGGPQARR
ncbi:ion transporter [Pseudonocardia sp. CA-107938]|uniref:ion transporter n=1 Tax=Pseudonocardia sp. CA-107938 TaxID=3240021 RepID=UPI003D92D832